MVSAAAASVARRNEAMVAALSKHLSALSLDPEKLSAKAVEEQDILSLFTSVLQLSSADACLKNKDEIMKWVIYANNLPSNAEDCHSALKGLNDVLSNKSVLVGDGLKTSEADVVVFTALQPVVGHLSQADKPNFPHLMRWMDYIQNTEDFGGAFEKIVIEKDPFPSLAFKIPDKVDSSQNSKKTTAATQTLATEQKGTALDPKKDVVLEKPAVESKSTEEKIKKGKKDTKEENKKATKDTAEKDADLSVIALNIQVGVIRKAWKHPSADSLLVEEIDLGDGNIRQVVSGLAKYCSPDDLSNRRVVLITNVKPGKLRDVMSSGLVLCASNQDHSIVEPLLPPEGAAPGERISFLGYEGKPEDVLNPKKKQLEKITPDLYTDDSGIATYKGIPFMTSAGPCTSSIPKAGIK